MLIKRGRPSVRFTRAKRPIPHLVILPLVTFLCGTPATAGPGSAGIEGRDTGCGSATYDFSPFVARQFRFGDKGALLGRAEAFNVFNHPNIVGRNGIYGNSISGQPLPSFGQPLGGINNVEPDRGFQFLLRVEC